MPRKDEQGRLRVAAAAGTGRKELERAEALFDAGVDIMVVDTAHGHSSRVLETVGEIRRMSNYTQVIVGNIATADGARALIEAGADAVKVGIGPGSICTTRMVAGVGVPQFTAIVDAVEECRRHGVPVIADGGIKFSGDLAKAIAAGADCAMLGSLFAGTDESPGEVFLYQGRSYKYYRGMGSIGAMARGSADRYFQQEVTDTLKLVPEGVEGRVAHKGPVGNIIHQLIGGLQRGDGLYRQPHDRRDAAELHFRPHHRLRPARKPRSRCRDPARGAELPAGDVTPGDLDDSGARIAAAIDHSGRDRRRAGGRPTTSPPIISAAAAISAPRTGCRSRPMSMLCCGTAPYSTGGSRAPRKTKSPPTRAAALSPRCC